MANVKYFRGTPEKYNAAVTANTIESDALYFIVENGKEKGKLYLGKVLLSDDISMMVGATDEENGVAGLVPAPTTADKMSFLRGDGTWAEIEIPETHQTQVFQAELIITDEDDSEVKEAHTVAIARVVGEATPEAGDIAVVKDPIANDKFQYTAYVFNGTDWVAMDGNYNAKNVFFDQDFTFTKAIGTVTIPSTGSKTVTAEGKNLYEFFAGLFAAEANPSTPSTSASITSSNIGAYEVGTNIAVKYAFNTTAGNYAYGMVGGQTGNGVQWTDHTATFNDETLNGASGTFTSVQVADDTSLSITGSVEQSVGGMPVTNLGNEYPAAQIQAKSWTNLSKGTLTGYRAWFCGYKNGTNKLDVTKLTSDDIRNLGNPANGSWTTQMEVSQMQQMFFAAPKGKGYKPSVKDHFTTAPQTVEDPIIVEVEGANGYDAIEYEVWYVNNAGAASGSATLDIAKA